MSAGPSRNPPPREHPQETPSWPPSGPAWTPSLSSEAESAAPTSAPSPSAVSPPTVGSGGAAWSPSPQGALSSLRLWLSGGPSPAGPTPPTDRHSVWGGPWAPWALEAGGHSCLCAGDTCPTSRASVGWGRHECWSGCCPPVHPPVHPHVPCSPGTGRRTSATSFATRQGTPPRAPCTGGPTPSTTSRCLRGSPRTGTRVSRRVMGAQAALAHCPEAARSPPTWALGPQPGNTRFLLTPLEKADASQCRSVACFRVQTG